MLIYVFFFIKIPASTEIYTLSLHDALPILCVDRSIPVTVHADGYNDRLMPVPTPTSSTDLPGWMFIFLDRKSTRLNSSHSQISYAVFCLKKKNKIKYTNIINAFDLKSTLDR